MTPFRVQEWMEMMIAISVGSAVCVVAISIAGWLFKAVFL